MANDNRTWPRRLASTSLWAILIVLSLWLFLKRGTAAREEPPAGRAEVVFWHFWGGADKAVVDGIVDRFNSSQRSHFVRAVALPGNNLDLKLFLSITGGDPPDLVNQDDPILGDWAARVRSCHWIKSPTRTRSRPCVAGSFQRRGDSVNTRADCLDSATPSTYERSISIRRCSTNSTWRSPARSSNWTSQPRRLRRHINPIRRGWAFYPIRETSGVGVLCLAAVFSTCNDSNPRWTIRACKRPWSGCLATDDGMGHRRLPFGRKTSRCQVRLFRCSRTDTPRSWTASGEYATSRPINSNSVNGAN